MRINKTGFIILNLLLLMSIIIGQYEWIAPRSVINIFVVPAFIISASLQYGTKKKKDE